MEDSRSHQSAVSKKQDKDRVRGTTGEMDRCGNCSFVFSASGGRTKLLELVVSSGPQSQSRVSVNEAFAVVQNVTGARGHTPVPVCSECAPLLSKAYEVVTELSQRREPSSFFYQQLHPEPEVASKTPAKGKKGKGGKRGKVVATKKATPAAQTNREKKVVKRQRQPKVKPQSEFAQSFYSAKLNGPTFDDFRPSRSAKLTAMVLMNNSWERQPIRSVPDRRAQQNSASSDEVEEEYLPVAKGSKVGKQGKKRGPAPTPTVANKKPKLEPTVIPTVEKQVSPLVVPKTKGGRKNKILSAAVSAPLDISKSLGDVSNTEREVEKAKVPKKVSKKEEKREIAKEVVAAVLPPDMSQQQTISKKGKSVKVDKQPNQLSTLDAPSDEILKPSLTSDSGGKKEKRPPKAKLLLPKVLPKQGKKSTENALSSSAPSPAVEERKKGKGSKGNAVSSTAGDQALDLTLKVSSPLAPSTLSPTPVNAKPKNLKVKAPVEQPPQPKKKSLNAVKLPAVPEPPIATAKLVPLKKESKKQKKPEELPKSEAEKEMGKIESPKTTKDSGAGKTFPCASCDKTFSARWNLRRHEMMVHELAAATPPFPCQACREVFQAKAKLFDHRMAGRCSSANLDGPNCVPSSVVPSALPAAPAGGPLQKQKPVPEQPKKKKDKPDTKRDITGKPNKQMKESKSEHKPTTNKGQKRKGFPESPGSGVSAKLAKDNALKSDSSGSQQQKNQKNNATNSIPAAPTTFSIPSSSSAPVTEKIAAVQTQSTSEATSSSSSAAQKEAGSSTDVSVGGDRSQPKVDNVESTASSSAEDSSSGTSRPEPSSSNAEAASSAPAVAGGVGGAGVGA